MMLSAMHVEVVALCLQDRCFALQILLSATRNVPYELQAQDMSFVSLHHAIF